MLPVSNTNANDKKADIVFIARDDIFIDCLVSYLSFKKRSLKADKCNSPSKFLANLQKYTKDTKICICHRDFNGIKMYGIELAKILHKDGYKKLYLLTGYNRDCLVNVPNYLMVLLKGDMDALDALLSWY